MHSQIYTHIRTYLTVYTQTHMTQTHICVLTHIEKHTQPEMNKDTPWDIHKGTHTYHIHIDAQTYTSLHILRHTLLTHTLAGTQAHIPHSTYTESHIHINLHTHASSHTGWGIAVLEKSQFFWSRALSMERKPSLNKGAVQPRGREESGHWVIQEARAK